jgi:hypothetical protein
MRTLRALASRVRGAFRSARDERDFEAQIQADIALHVEDAIRAGASPEEARRQALVKFGGLDAAREAWRDRRGLPFLETLVRDITQALRVLGRNKGWSAVAIASLALGVGASAAVFSAANALLLRKMPVPDPDSIVTLRWEGQNRAMTSFSDYGFVPNGAVPSLFEELTPDYFFNRMKAGVTAPYPTFQRLSAANTTLAQLFAVGPGPTVNLIVDGKGDTASSQFVSGGFYATAAVPPAAGRGGRHQPRVLAAALRHGSVRCRQARPHQHRRVHDRRRVRSAPAGHDQGLALAAGSHDCSRERAAVSARRVPARAGDELVARDDGPAQARHHCRAGAGQSCSDLRPGDA